MAVLIQLQKHNAIYNSHSSATCKERNANTAAKALKLKQQLLKLFSKCISMHRGFVKISIA